MKIFGDMIIETKYNIGDEVWVMHQKPTKVMIKRISCYCGRWGHLLKEEVMYLADNDCCFSEDLLFPTKEELLKSL